MKYIKGLDTLRAFAVISVILGHWGHAVYLGPTGEWLFSVLFPSATFGVHLFFTLSGFLITSILLDAKEVGGNKFTIIRNFLARRTLRIFPIYYITIFVLILMGFPDIRQYSIWFLSFTSNVLAYRTQSWNSFSHTWTLAVEEQFYLLWPFLIILVHLRFVKYVLYATVVAGILFTLVLRLSPGDHPWGLVLTPACLQIFGIGALYAYFRRQGEQLSYFIRPLSVIFPFALILHFYWTFSQGGDYFNYGSGTNDAILSVWLIHKTISIGPGWLKHNLMENRFLVKTGQVSYGLYLYHFMLPDLYKMFVRRVGGKLFLSNRVFYCCFLPILLLAISLASFEFIEKPFLRLKRYFRY